MLQGRVLGEPCKSVTRYYPRGRAILPTYCHFRDQAPPLLARGPRRNFAQVPIEPFLCDVSSGELSSLAQAATYRQSDFATRVWNRVVGLVATCDISWVLNSKKKRLGR